MRTLVIDCASEACSVALFDGDALLSGDWRVLGRGHAEALVPMIAALPGKGKATRIAVALGPGSFTGVRVGLAAAKALALAWDAELVGYSTLALIAAQALAQRGDQGVSVATTGGHGEWFIADFDAAGTELSPLTSRRPEDAVRSALFALVAGTQAESLVMARGTGEALTILPDARKFTLLGESALTADVAPIYGRPPDARLPGQLR